MSRMILLTQGRFALVDDEDYDYLNQWNWHFNHGYAIQRAKNGRIAMHRLLMGLFTNDGRQVDHINHNTLDNRKKNLRVCTNAENHLNIESKCKLNKYKGVTERRHNRWEANITANHETIYLGCYFCEELAALAYDFAAMKYHREFANFNF